MTGPYDDIIHLPHFVSTRHARMSQQDRAAQFSPFAALTGYDATIREAGRLTCQRVDLGPDARQELEEALAYLRDHLEKQPQVSVTYFLPDTQKSGGVYVTATDLVLKLDTHRRLLQMGDGREIPFHDILSVKFPEAQSPWD